MSATCLHLSAEAADHPECTGCRALLLELVRWWTPAADLRMRTGHAIIDDPLPAPRPLRYSCPGCSEVCELGIDRAIADARDLAVKTVGSHYCVGCIDAEVAAHGVSRDEVIALCRRHGQAVPSPSRLDRDPHARGPRGSCIDRAALVYQRRDPLNLVESH